MVTYQGQLLMLMIILCLYKCPYLYEIYTYVLGGDGASDQLLSLKWFRKKVLCSVLAALIYVWNSLKIKSYFTLLKIKRTRALLSSCLSSNSSSNCVSLGKSCNLSELLLLPLWKNYNNSNFLKGSF